MAAASWGNDYRPEELVWRMPAINYGLGTKAATQQSETSPGRH